MRGVLISLSPHSCAKKGRSRHILCQKRKKPTKQGVGFRVGREEGVGEWAS